jgi:uncharacterized protein YecA (UPF0149 family)
MEPKQLLMRSSGIRMLAKIVSRRKLRRSKMLMIEEVYTQLQENAFVDTAEEFSTDWCWRSKSWFAVQKNKGSDFTIAVAINCLNSIKIKIAQAHMRRKKFGSIAESDLSILRQVRDKLEQYLLEQHRVAAVAEQVSQQHTMLGFQ